MKSPAYRTPKNAGTIVCLLLGLYALRPVVDKVYYTVGLRTGAFAANSDSIGIPLADGWTGWLIGWPIIILLTVAFARTYTGDLSFTFFDRTRLVWSLLWTIPILAFCAWDLLGALYNLRWLQIIDFVDAALISYVALSLRSSLLAFRRHPTQAVPSQP